MLSRYTSVESLEQYDKLYEEYVNEKYEVFEHSQKQEKAKKFVHSHGYQNITQRFDVITATYLLFYVDVLLICCAVIIMKGYHQICYLMS